MLVNLFALLVRLVRKVRSPMAKVRWYNEHSIFIIKIFSQTFSVLWSEVLINNSYNNWNHFDLILLIKRFFDQRQMHFNAMLFFLLLFSHLCVDYYLFQLLYGLFKLWLHSLSTVKFPKGVYSSSIFENEHPLKYLWCEGPSKNTLTF